MKGKLTQAHIDKGVRDMCRECPVALSISDMVAGHKRAGDAIIVEVGVKQVRLHTGDYEVPFLVADLDGLLEAVGRTTSTRARKSSTGTIYIKRGTAVIEDVEGNTVQRWRCGIAVDDNA